MTRRIGVELKTVIRYSIDKSLKIEIYTRLYIAITVKNKKKNNKYLHIIL